jgi:hypothetical protein
MNPMPETIWAGHSRRIQDGLAALERVGEAVDADEHEQRGSDADERVRRQPGALLAHLALDADRRREHEREPEPP